MVLCRESALGGGGGVGGGDKTKLVSAYSKDALHPPIPQII